MKVNKLTQFVDTAFKFYDDHQREIMLGTAIAGTVVTAVLSWRAGIKADKIISEQKVKLEGNEKDMLEGGADEAQIKEMKREVILETVKKVAPIVALPALSATGTIISVIGGYKVASKQIAVLSGLYSMSEKAFSEYQEKTKEIAGPKKEQEIRDEANAAIAQKALNNNPEIIETGKGNVLFYDKYCGRFFRSSWESIRAAVNTVNADAIDNMDSEVPYNELMREYGLESDTVFGDMFVFKRVSGGNLIDLRTSSYNVEGKVNPANMEIAHVIDYHNPPKVVTKRGSWDD